MYIVVIELSEICYIVCKIHKSHVRAKVATFLSIDYRGLLTVKVSSLFHVWAPEVLGELKITLVKAQDSEELLKFCYSDMPYLPTVPEFRLHKITL